MSININDVREVLNRRRETEPTDPHKALIAIAPELADEVVRLHDKFAELADDLEQETRLLGIVGFDDRIEQATLDIRETLEGDSQ